MRNRIAWLHHISKTDKILDHALGYLKALEQLFKYRQVRLIVIGKIYQNLSLRPLEYILRPFESFWDHLDYLKTFWMCLGIDLN